MANPARSASAASGRDHAASATAAARGQETVARQEDAPRREEGPRLSIGQVLEQLQPEFPSLTISKLRFLEDQGLVTPRRTPSGYRQFSTADVERVQFVLECQRDRFWPLKVIRQRLEEVDEQRNQPPGPRAVATAPHGRLSAQDLAREAEVELELVEEVTALGLIKVGPSNRYNVSAIAVVRAVSHLFSLGIDARHLRAFRAAADRETGLVDQMVAPLRNSTTAAGIAQAQSRTEEVTGACLALHAALLHDTVSRLDQ